MEKYPEEGNRMFIFPEDLNNQNAIISEPEISKIEYKKRWKVLESLRENDCLGVKQ